MFRKILLLMFASVLLFNFSSAIISQPSFCCERSNSGGVCLNLPQDQCDTGFRMASTSCEATSFCRLGTCFDSKEGVCMENVPQQTCVDSGGAWSEKQAFELPQCNLGCCIISDQAAFVSLVRCKKLSSNFGIEMDYRPTVATEGECIALANSQDKGACVTYTATGVNTCTFTTRGQCGALDGVIALNVETNIFDQELGKKFFKDILCSAEELNTECARQVKTECNNGKVYWVDSCGNLENVYSSDKDVSWNNGRVADPDDICARVGNSRDCGNCDYFLGGRCDEWKGFLGIGKPAFGDYYCKATTCRDLNGKTRLNGESWCVYDVEPGRGFEVVGSRHFRQICIDGEVVTDACGDFRNQICIHSGIPTSAGEFSTAACRVNRWQDCSAQTLKRDCENIDARDCVWVEQPEGMNFSTGGQQSSFSNPTSEFGNPSAQGSDSTLGQVAGAAGAAAPLAGMFQGGSQTQNNPTSGSNLAGLAIANIQGAGRGIWEIDYDILNKVDKFNKSEEDEGGLCVPMIPPGHQFWDSQGQCGMASANCEVKIIRTERYDGLFAGLDADKEYSWSMRHSNGSVIVESECLEWEGGRNPGDSKSYSLLPKRDWALKVNAICTSIGDCGANVNINQKYTDDGYLWKYENNSFSLMGSVERPRLLSTGRVIQGTENDFVINDEIRIKEDAFVLVKR